MTKEILRVVAEANQESVDILENDPFIILDGRSTIIMVEDLAFLSPFFNVVHSAK